ncbi:uncharacterized protein LOC144125688 [Amblyomma americanum]
MSLPADTNELNTFDDNFWDEFDDDSALLDTSEANSISNDVEAKGTATPARTEARHMTVATGHGEKSVDKTENNSDDSLFVATGLCAEDLENCFEDDFDEHANDSESKKGAQKQHSCSDSSANIPEILPDMFNDDSMGWLADEPELVPRKRKFPGPAGILPKSRSSLSFSGVGEAADKAASRKMEPPDDLLCTPWSAEADDPLSPWQYLRRDLGMENIKSGGLNGYTITWVLKMKRLQQLPRGKVPVLCVAVKNVSKDILTLRDGTGEILATVDKDCQDYKPCLKAGSAIVLMKASVYVNDQGQHCLVLTKQNIVQIYSCTEDGSHDVVRADVNPMTLQELEGVCALLQREALEDAAKRDTRGLECQSSVLNTCAPPVIKPRAGHFSPVLNNSRNGNAQLVQGRGNVSPGLFSNTGTGSTALQPRTGGASPRQPWMASRGAVPVSRHTHSSNMGARPSRPQGAGVKRPSEGFKENTINPEGHRASPSMSKVPAYKPPALPSAKDSGVKPACEVSSAIDLLKSSAANRPQIASHCLAGDNRIGSRCVKNTSSSTVDSAVATTSLSSSVLPNDSSASAEELQWLEDDADDIFQTIDDVCLV